MADTDTIFHKIIRREIPAQIVAENEELIAIRDIVPASRVHVLVIPKKTLPQVSYATADDALLLGKMVLFANEIAKSEGIAESGYRLVFNCGADGGQTVPQLHLHLLGGREFSWPPG